LREAIAVIWDGKRDRAFKRSQKREDATVYLLPPLPCRLLITTGEKKVFAVTILSAGKSGEGDMGVPRNVSGIRLRYELADHEVVPTASPDLVQEATPVDSLTATSVERKVRDVIAKFAEAAVKGDKPTVAECLHPKMHGLLDELDEVAESVSDGLKLDDIHSVFVRGDRALVATEMGSIPGRKSLTRACTVYTLVKVGESWLIEDVDMKDENTLAQKIGRFHGKSPAQVEEQKVRGVIAKYAQALEQGDKAAMRQHLHPNMWDLLNDDLNLIAEMVAEGMKTDEIRSMSVDGDRASVATEMFVIGDIQMPPACTVYRLVKVHGSWLIEAIELEDEKGRDVKLHLFKNWTPNDADGSREQAEMLGRQADASCRELETALEMYRLDMGTYPTTEAGLAALVEKPKNTDPRGKWNGPYVSKLPTDPWGLSYRYRRLTEPDGTRTTIWSHGPDRRDGTDDDISVGIDYDNSDAGNTTTETPVAPMANANANATATGRLDLRVAAVRGGDGKTALDEKNVGEYLDALENNGPEAGQRRGDPFAWFPMNDKPRPPMITADRGGQSFVLLANTPEHTMLCGSTQPWRMASVTVHHALQGRPAISVELDETGGRRLGELTETHLDLPMAILVDDRVLSAPTIVTKVTTRFQISGSFDIEEAGRLAQAMMSGIAPSEPANDESAEFNDAEEVPGTVDSVIPR